MSWRQSAFSWEKSLVIIVIGTSLAREEGAHQNAVVVPHFGCSSGSRMMQARVSCRTTDLQHCHSRDCLFTFPAWQRSESMSQPVQTLWVRGPDHALDHVHTPPGKTVGNDRRPKFLACNSVSFPWLSSRASQAQFIGSRTQDPETPSSPHVSGSHSTLGPKL